MGEVTINAVRYILATDKDGHAMLRERYVQRLGQSIRLVGVQQRDQDTSVNRFISSSFPLGIGWGRMDRRSGRGVGGLKDATVDTRFKPVTLGRLHESQTHVDPRQHPKVYVNYNNNTYAIFEEDYDAAEITNVMDGVWNPATNTWDAGNTIVTPNANANGARVFDAVVHKGTMVALTNGTVAAEQQFLVSSSTGGAWTSYINVPGTAVSLLDTTITRRNNFDDDEGKLLDYGNLLLAAVYDDVTDNQIEVYSTAGQGAAAWDARGTTRDRRVHALLTWRDPTDLSLRIPILVTERNVYKIDTAAATLTALLPDGILTGDANDGRGAVVGLDGKLYLPLGSGQIMTVEIVGENALKYARIGPPGDGLVTARQGHVNKMLVVPEPWLIVAYGGHAASRTASIFAIDYEPRIDPESGKEYQAWHSLYSEADANIDLYLLGYSTNTDAVSRLFFALEHATDAEMYHIEEPFVHPNASTTIQYQPDTASMYLRQPDDAMGDPQTVSTIYHAFVDADALGTASTERIQLQLGLDYADDDASTVGNFISTAKTLVYGTQGTPGGVRGFFIRQRLNFARGTTTTLTPKLYEFEFWAQAKLTTSRAWDMVIDVEATKEAGYVAPTATQEAQEVIIANIETLATAKGVTVRALFDFQYAQNVAAVGVRIPVDTPPDFDNWKVGDSRENLGYRTGFIKLRLEEVTT